jgi:hypothetical protein
MADAYWISNVGGVDIVGPADFMRDTYEGLEYVPAEDNDFADRQYSTLAAASPGTFDAISDTDISLVEVKEYEEALGALWDTSEDFIDGPLADLIDDQYGDEELDEYDDEDELGGFRERRRKRRARRKKRRKRRRARRRARRRRIAKAFKKLGGDIVHTMNKAVQLPGKAVKATLGKIPLIGEPITAAVNLSPAKALGGFTSRVARGERIDRAFLRTGKEQLKAAKTLAPYVQSVVSFVPGVGTGVAAAIAAGTAIAEGRTITEAVLRGVKGALPGGAAAATAFDTAIALTKGQRIDKAALNAVKRQLPAGAREAVSVVEGVARGKTVSAAALNAVKRRLPPQARGAVDAAVDAAKGKPINAKDVLLRVARAEMPPQARKAFETGAAMGAARTIQSAVVNKSADRKTVSKLAKHGAAILKTSPRALRKSARGLSRNRKAGFMAALGAISKRGQTSHALAATRSALGIAQQKGFDHGLKTVLERTMGRTKGWASLVTRGRVLRGNWVAARPRSRGAIYGKLIKGRKSKTGWFRRV